MLYFITLIAVLAVDILTKLFAVNTLTMVDTIPLWDGVFHLTYVENRGAAFGIFQNGRGVFIIVTILIIGVGAIMLRRYKRDSKLLNIAAVFVTAGAIGNLIDRIRYGFVVDFLDFRLINFPVFNVADIFICIGAILICIYVIFFDENSNAKKESDKDED